MEVAENQSHCGSCRQDFRPRSGAKAGVSHFIVTFVTLTLSSLYHLLTVRQESRMSDTVRGSLTEI